MDEPPALGARIKGLRQSRGMTLVAAAKAAGISRAHYWNLENRPVNPSRELLLKVAELYGTTVAELVDDRPEVVGERPRLQAIFRNLKELSDRDLDTLELLIRQFKAK